MRVKARCEACEADFEVQHTDLTCPRCGSELVWERKYGNIQVCNKMVMESYFHHGLGARIYSLPQKAEVVARTKDKLAETWGSSFSGELEVM